jgi:hypothetical protein
MKRKLKIITLSITVGLLLFLAYSNYRIHGTWMKLYDYETKYPETKFNGSTLLNFEYVNFQIFSPSFPDANKSKVFVIFDKVLLYDRDFPDEDISIQRLTKDSLVFSDSRVTTVYRKIPDSLKKEDAVQFANKLIRFKINENVDTIYFSEDVMLHKNKFNGRSNWVHMRYRWVELNGFQFISNNFGYLMPVKRELGKTHFYRIYKDSIVRGSMTEINSTLEIEKEIKFKLNNLKVLEQSDPLNPKSFQ